MTLQVKMKMKIHKTKEQARAALEEYTRRVVKLQAKFGVWEESTGTRLHRLTQYYDRDGNCKKECY